MIPFTRKARAVAAGLASAALLAPTATAQNTTPSTTPGAAAGQNGAVTLREVDIRAFIEDVSNATGRTFIIDPRVSGRVTVLSQQSMSERELMDVFMSTLRVNGFVAVPTANGAYRIVPAEVAAREPSTSGAGPSDNTYVSQVFSLRFADAETVAAAIRPMLSERGQVTVNRRGNSVVVVDFGSTIGRLRDVIGTLDRDNSTVRSLRLENTSAAEMARVAQNLATAIGEEGRPLIRAVPVASSNMLVLRGDERALDQLVPLIQELDTRANYQAGVSVIPLRYAVAADLVPILQQLSASMGVAPGEDAAQSQGRRANIAQHAATNSLIISADPETQESLTNVVRSLDVRREQVLVEAIIVEVSDQTARELGLQYVASGASGENALPFMSTSYGGSAPNILALTGAALLRGDGDDDEDEDSEAIAELRRAAINSLLGSSGLLLGGGGQDDDGRIFGVLLNALAQDEDSNVLSTPSVMTLDNEEASILVGQQIPITTGEAVGDNLDNQFRTISREDVGVKLEVRPQISEGGAIRLEIRQEVSSIFGQIIDDSTDLITNRREIQTVVQVDAGEIIVLGGLIQDDIQRRDEGIPGLRRIPIAGRLFRSEGRSHQRTNLMVFLRPTIVNTSEQARAVTRRQYESVRSYDGLDPLVARALEAEMSRNEPVVAPAPAPAQ
ncbi:type II secretion system secretin GspD [Vitreimonas sp.]|uniref:type II secretion system secretin GspD n=1 Tax=Vitreimonas sp. TaxID=3069702 RepID=UPI002ED80E93